MKNKNIFRIVSLYIFQMLNSGSRLKTDVDINLLTPTVFQVLSTVWFPFSHSLVLTYFMHYIINKKRELKYLKLFLNVYCKYYIDALTTASFISLFIKFFIKDIIIYNLHYLQYFTFFLNICFAYFNEIVFHFISTQLIIICYLKFVLLIYLVTSWEYLILVIAFFSCIQSAYSICFAF